MLSFAAEGGESAALDAPPDRGSASLVGEQLPSRRSRRPSFAPIITANWKADSDDRWTIPFGGGFGKIVKVGKAPPMNINLQAFYNVEHPDVGPEWSARFQLALLFPK